MRLSLKLLLLLVALAAVLLEWDRSRQVKIAAELQSVRNTDRHARTITVYEESSPPSTLNVDAAGVVSFASLSGPAGYLAITERPRAQRQLEGLNLRSKSAIDLFRPAEFPNLESLSYSDAYDVDFSHLSLVSLSSVRKLRTLVIYAGSSDPRLALSTLPKSKTLKLIVSTDQLESFDDFPCLDSVSALELRVPEGSDTESILATLQNRLPDCQVVVWENFPPIR